MQRRNFVKAGVFAGLGAVTGRRAFAGNDPDIALSASAIMVDAQRLGRLVPETFTGLSYELAQLTEPEFFSPSNTELIAFFRRLSPSGVLRIGGNSSEFCWFRATPATPPIELKVPPGDLGANYMPHRTFTIEPAAVDNLAAFLAATGWQAIYGLNYGHSTPERAATEAAYVHAKLGDRLRYFQIGNEPDFYRDSNNGVRPAGWGFDDYVREWIAYADAVTARVPGARFGGPDTGASSDWVERFGERVAPRLGGRLVALTGHYYAEGPPDAPTTTTARLLAGDPNVAASTSAIVRVADAHRLVYRMTEGNTCYRGGKPGMSDTFASSLWAADYMLELATLGAAGVNLHGGTASFLTASLGDHSPGLNVAGARKTGRTGGFYTPISTEPGEPVAAMPIFYGMMFAQSFSGARMLQIEQPADAPLCHIYAAVKSGKLLIGVINKGEARTSVTLRFQGLPHRLQFHRTALEASSTASIDVRLGSASVAPASAVWQPKQMSSIVAKNGGLTLNLGLGGILLQQT